MLECFVTIWRRDVRFNSNGLSESGIGAIKKWLCFNNSIRTSQLVRELVTYANHKITPKFFYILNQAAGSSTESGRQENLEIIISWLCKFSNLKTRNFLK